MKRIVRTFIIVIGLTVAIGVSLVFVFSRANAQDDIVSDLVTRLKEQGVPVKSAEITSRIPFRVKFVLQSASESQVVAPNDPLFEHAVQREVTLAHRRNNTRFNTVKVVIVNKQGKTIYRSDVPVRTIGEEAFSPSELDDVATAELIRKEITLYGMSLEELEVSSNAHRIQTVNVDLSVPDIQTANKAIPKVMPDLGMGLKELNVERGAQIAICRVNLIDAEGHLLLKYIADLQLSQEKWWQAEALTREWFPHPHPAPEPSG